MCTTRNSSNGRRFAAAVWIIGLGTVTFSGLISGQVYAQPAYEWPRTFSGQPDFDFNKQEVLAEQKKRAAEGEIIATEAASWLDLLRDSRISPHNLTASTSADNENTAEADTDLLQALAFTETSSTTAAPLATDASATSTPDAGTEQEQKMAGFSTFLENTLQQNMSTLPASTQEINVNKILKNLNIQTIATSPSKYVLINNRRYHEGDILRVAVKVPPDARTVEKLLADYLPDPAIVGNESFKAYNDIKQDVFKKFVRNRSSQKNYLKDYMLEIAITDINPRQFSANILNKKHVLQLSRM